MSEFKPTKAQSAAINARGSAVLISAGAGSGKTKVLTERLMSFLCDKENPADLDSFLIITFTRAAAGELRGRIMDELAGALARDPSNHRLRRQSALCQRAQIGTIHSFCATLLRENSYLAGISPDFKIMDESRAQVMKASALERVLERRYEKADKYPEFSFLADTVGVGRDDSRLAALVLNLHSKMQSHDRPELWAAKQLELLRAEPDDVAQSPWGQEILGWADGMAGYWSDEFDRLMHEMAGDEKISKAYMPGFSGAAEALRELRRCIKIGWDRAREQLPVTFPRLGRLVNSPNPELSEKLKLRWKDCKKAMETLEKSLSAQSAVLLSEMAQTSPAMSALLALVLDFDKEYSKDKRRAGFVDYADLEHMTARLLTEEDGTPTELAVEISRRYTEIMVDEYQDVSQVQDTIFRAVSKNERNLFLVGDVKQSIYRFRLADPGIFTEKYLRYKNTDEAQPGEARRIMLQENFRSRAEILSAANTVFSLCMSSRLGDIDYDENAELKYGASYVSSVPKPEIMLLGLPETGDEEESPDKTAMEAQQAARRIRELVDSGLEVSSGAGSRPIRYGDVAILLRSVNAVGGIYRRELSKAGVPVSAGQGGGFFSAMEVSTVVSMLAVIDNPHQDVPLIAVLRSPAFGFSADELSKIRSREPKTDFFTALMASAEEDGACRRFAAKLDELRAIAPDMEISELVWLVLEELDLLAVCSAMADGRQRRARLMELIELSERFEATGYRGLHRFVLWLRKLSEKGEEPVIGSPSESAVQIMSVHKSKGLEFPVVFFCDAARRFNKQDSRDMVLVHPELGLGPKLTDLKRRVEYPTLARNAIKLRLEHEQLSEEMRLLYVALTRAKERLFVTATVKNPEKTLERAAALVTKPMPPELLAQAQAPIDWLIYAALADAGANISMTVSPADAVMEAAAVLPETIAADEELAKTLEKNLSFQYPYLEAQRLPSKVTATELKTQAEPDEDAQSIAPKLARSFRMPDFAKAEKSVTGAERGIATHLVLQFMDFGKTGSLELVQGEIERLKRAKFLSERQAKAVNAGAIVKLFASPLGARMLDAASIKREFKFSLLCDAEQVFGSAPGESVLLQGVVDCYIEEPDGIVIIDYKTDYLKNENEALARAEIYKGQLKAYSAALERIVGKPVKECVLYFLSVSKAVELSPNE